MRAIAPDNFNTPPTVQWPPPSQPTPPRWIVRYIPPPIAAADSRAAMRASLSEGVSPPGTSGWARIISRNSPIVLNPCIGVMYSELVMNFKSNYTCTYFSVDHDMSLLSGFSQSFLFLVGWVDCQSLIKYLTTGPPLAATLTLSTKLFSCWKLYVLMETSPTTSFNLSTA